MSSEISPQEFLAAVDLPGWRVVDGCAVARFETGTFSRGVDFLTKVAALADRLSHHPDADLTYPHVTIRLITHDAGGVLTGLDVEAAIAISQIATEAGIEILPE